MRIRRFDPTRDAAGLRACFVELQEYERTLQSELPEPEAIVDAYLADLHAKCAAAQGAIFLAEDEEVVGFVAVLSEVLQDELDEPPEPYAYISDLVVRTRARRSGIGEALMRTAVEHARASKRQTLKIGVLSRNAPAQRLYERLGFVEYRRELRLAL